MLAKSMSSRQKAKSTSFCRTKSLNPEALNPKQLYTCSQQRTISGSSKHHHDDLNHGQTDDSGRGQPHRKRLFHNLFPPDGTRRKRESLKCAVKHILIYLHARSPWPRKHRKETTCNRQYTALATCSSESRMRSNRDSPASSPLALALFATAHGV